MTCENWPGCDCLTDDMCGVNPPSLTRAQTDAYRMLRDAIQAAQGQHLARWLYTALSDAGTPDQQLEEIGNIIGRIPHERARVAL